MRKLITILLIFLSIPSFSQKVLDGNVGVIGNSTIAAYVGQNAVSSYLRYTGTLTDIAYPGHTILQQKTAWDNLSSGTKSALNYVFVQIGLNDLSPYENLNTHIGEYQSLINDINSSAPNAKVVLCTMNPCKARWAVLYGANGPTAYQNWIDFNEAIKGNGGNAITGGDQVISSHTTSLDDGDGNLAGEFDTGDHIHENNAGRIIIAAAWMEAGLTFPSLTAYYVSPTGDDSGTGLWDDPWATWQKGINTAIAGDTVYFRGGIWQPTAPLAAGVIISYKPSSGRGHNGTYANPICFYDFPGEVPILDCGSVVIPGNTGRYALAIEGATYFKFRGLEIRNLKQEVEETYINAVDGVDLGVASFERMNVHHNWGAGFFFGGAGEPGYDTLYLKNCDSHDNVDSLSTSNSGNVGGHADGFQISSGGLATDTFKIVYIEGCRSWSNSDDGIDLGTTKQFDVHDNWLFNGGALDGDGNGFKLSYSSVMTTSKRRIRNCLIAFDNGAVNPATGSGIAAANLVDAYYGPRGVFVNNTVYKCQYGFNDGYSEWNCLTGKAQDIFRNNIQYASYATMYVNSFTACNFGFPVYIIADHNTFSLNPGSPHCITNPDYTVTDADFVLTDSTQAMAQLTAPRKADGSLPDITFMKLAIGSDLIDGGVDVGLAYSGTAPDLGYSEYGTSAPFTATNITAFSISGQTGSSTINSINHTVTVHMPYGSGVTTLSPTITVSAGAIINPTSGTVRNFSSPVTYTVTAEDNTTQEWTVTVIVDAEITTATNGFLKSNGKFMKSGGKLLKY